MAFRAITENEKDALTEIANVGMGNAAMALSQFTGCEIKLLSSSVKLTPGAGFKARGYIFNRMPFKGDLNGEAVFAFSRSAASRLIALIAKNNSVSIDLSALNEVLNVFVGNYLSAVSKLLEIKIIHSLPKNRGTPSGSEYTISFNTPISLEGKNLCGSFLLVINQSNLNRLFGYIRKKTQ